jgi:small GTP-binding protein
MAVMAMKSKVCLVGESAVGKTSLIKKYILDVFDDSYISTLGTKVSKKTMAFDHKGVQISMDMMIWDIMGQASFRTLLKDAYFYGANGIIAVCDVTRKETLSSLDDWIKSVSEVAGQVPLVILANKCDLAEGAQISGKDLELKARRFHAPYFFTSAKHGDNVNEAFLAMAQALIQAQAKGAK